MSDTSDNVNAAADVVRDIYSTVGDSHKKEISSNLGSALVTVSAAVNNVLLPIAVVNYAVDKARIYFQNKFEGDLEKEVSDIPPEALIEPKASFAAPIIQGLAFAVDEPDLKSMYLKLLASAMDGRSAENAHPAFVEVIKQCSAQDILLINYFANRTYPHVQTIDLFMIINNRSSKVYGDVGPYILESGLTYKNYMVTIDNLIRLGVIKNNGATSESYDEIINTTVAAYRQNVHLGGIETYQTKSKTLWITSFGMSLIINCIRTDLKNMPLNMLS